MERNLSLKKRWSITVIYISVIVLSNNFLQEDEEAQTMTVKEIEEQKRKEKVLQQKKVLN